MLYEEELISVFEEAIASARIKADIEARMTVALSMLGSGMSYEEIEKFTRVTQEDIADEIENNIDWDTEWDRNWRSEQDYIQRNGMDDQTMETIADVAEQPTVNLGLEIRLKEWRSKHYKALNIPAYRVIPNKTLIEIATKIPRTREELMAVKGFGETRWEKFGEEILAITSEF